MTTVIHLTLTPHHNMSPSSSPSLLLLLALLTATFVLSNSATAPSDTAALRSFYSAVTPSSIPPGSCLSSWDFTLDPCDSSFTTHFTCGLRCDTTISSLRRVTDLTLDPAGYSGNLSSAVWSLPFLTTLHLADNQFSSPIPPAPSTGLPAGLKRITLSRNLFNGEVPNLAPAPGLEELSLDENQIWGGMERVVWLGGLRRLEVQGNELNGELPDMRGLKDLYFLDASYNGLSGAFPAGLPAGLVELSLRGNGLEGEVDGGAVAGMTSLQVIDLSSNHLSGAVPAAVFEHPSLQQLSLSYNQLQAVSSPSDGGAGSQLVAVDLGHNRISGFLPGFMGTMPRLSAVDLQDNRFTGMIPTMYALRAAAAVAEGVAPFGRLLLSGNYLFGPIPSPMGVLKEGSATISLADNCLMRCPSAYFFCEGGVQKAPETCRGFNPVIP